MINTFYRNFSRNKNFSNTILNLMIKFSYILYQLREHVNMGAEILYYRTLITYVNRNTYSIAMSIFCQYSVDVMNVN